MKLYLSGKLQYYKTAQDANTKKANYDTKHYTNNPSSPKSVSYAGKDWNLFYSGSKELKGWKFAALLTQSLALTIFSLGLWLISDNLRADWQAILDEKKTREIYIEANNSSTQNTTNSSVQTNYAQTVDNTMPLTNEELFAKSGAFSQYYTDNKIPMRSFLAGIGCKLDKVHTQKGDFFLKSEKYIHHLNFAALKDFHNDNEITITVSADKIRSIMESSKVVVSPFLGPDTYKLLLKQEIQEDKKFTNDMLACQVCHSIKLPALTSPFLHEGKAHQQLKNVDLDQAPEIILLSTPAANFAYGNKQPWFNAFIQDDNLKFDDFKDFMKGMWGNIIYSAKLQGATDLSLVPIGCGVFLESAPLSEETKDNIKKAYLVALKEVINNDKVSEHFKNGIFLGKMKFTTEMLNEVFADCKTPIHPHEVDALNLSQIISAQPGRTCAVLNPSDPAVLFGRYNIGMLWQTSVKGTTSHVGEEYLMHFIPGMLGSYDMCPGAFENAILQDT